MNEKNFLSRLMVAIRPLNFVLLLSKEDIVVRQKYNFLFCNQTVDGVVLYFRGTQARCRHVG